MFNEQDFEKHLQTLDRQELIELCMYWKKTGSNYYWKSKKQAKIIEELKEKKKNLAGRFAL